MDYSRQFSHLQKVQQRKKKLFQLLTFFLIFFVGGTLFVISRNYHSKNSSQAVESSQFIPSPINIPKPSDPPNSSGLSQVVQQALQGTHGTYGIVIHQLDTNEAYHFNAHQVFKSGSLYKLWVMAVVYQQIQQGKLYLDDTLSKDIETLAKEFDVSIDPSEPQTSGILTMTVSDALNQMITISDNNAALLLTDKVKLSSLTQFLLQYGFFESKVGIHGEAPTTTASDTSLFFEKLYKAQLANKQQTTNMLNLLKQQRLNDKIPLNLPSSLSIAHKTGEIEDYTHDGGIIYSPKGTYIIVVLTQSDDTDAAKTRIANISDAVYNYFNP